jgi:hypothetical protein
MPRGINEFDEDRLDGLNFGDANSSNIVSPGIVTDGLVLNLDAGNYQSYPIAGTTWYDLSGYRINGTISSGPVYIRSGGGAIDFLGGSFTSEVVTGSISSPISSDFSIEFFIRRDGNQVQLASVFTLGGSGASGSLQIDFGPTDNTNTLRLVLQTTAIFSDTASLPDNTWAHFVVTKNGTTFSLFRDGVFVTSATSSLTASLQNFNIGQNRGGDRNFGGAVSFLRFYFKGFSPPEVSQNFNATRARFNI